jgi:huntingtin interacting protein 1
MITSVSTLSSDSQKFDQSIQSLIQYFQQLSYVFSCGKSIEQSLPNIELGQELLKHIKNLGQSSVSFNQNIRERVDTQSSAANITKSLDEIISLKKKILPELSSDVSKDIGDQLKEELSEMETAIRDAARRIEELSANSKKTDTGVKLEVNEKILDSCTDLISSIIRLIQDSKALQEEIVSQGKGSSGSAKEFYQRNGRWTEGLISAAKVVALAAKLLVDAADKVISGKAKLSELMAASNEIAAATAQLVVASRVKADRTSEKLSNLSHSSKRVSESTGNIVATAKVCSQKLENNISKLDFSALSLTQAKKLEFECQANVIEMQFQLDKERERLASLRKQHYHLAGASGEA